MVTHSSILAGSGPGQGGGGGWTKQNYGQKSLVGYSPWGHKESDLTEGLSVHPHTGGPKTPCC